MLSVETARQVRLRPLLDTKSHPQFRVGYSTIADRDQRDVANGVTTERHVAFLVVGWACELARSMLHLLIKREGANGPKDAFSKSRRAYAM
jgi:hypothetical protein